MTPKKTAAPFLWFSFCFGNIIEAVVLGSVQYPSDNGLHSHLDARGPAEDSTSSTSVHVPSYMISLYRTLSELDRRGGNGSQTRTRRYANTVTSFMDLGQDELSLKFHQQYTFDLSGLSRLDELMEVELRVLRRPPPDVLSLISRGGNLYRLLLGTCSLPGSSHQSLLLTSRTIDLLDTASATWDVFDVGASVKTHLKLHRTVEGSRPLCFSISAVSDSNNEAVHPSMLGLSHVDQQTHERALLVAFSRTRKKENLFREIREKIKAMKSRKFPAREHDIKSHPRHRRRRRTALAGRPGVGPVTGGGGGGKGGGRRRTRCSRKPLHVNFKELGWDDWIIAPLDYEAYHCEGLCDFPLRSHLEPTNHAIIQTLMNSMDPESTPPSCCVPSKLSPISILYIDSGNNVVYKQYEDMVVESCGCR
ncbi:growth/differentiation factor 6-A [Rhinichthys klamathensis goyatoka]|uniref:growth/differentiation factor 6-A n=1 Tax=Rhinichthys klamathensis goyatoka TaxID=3034132 RepID=UPI0024B4C367|nr:growth/differentiation factor 6-A [Rhinichthys klamathensis goyatoka]